MASRTFDKNIEIRTDLRASSSVLGERTSLQNAILNLAINARDAMPEGGVLTLSTCDLQRPRSSRRSTPDPKADSSVEVVVADTGNGIDRATRERVFEPFFTTKEVGKGTGLGLSLVYATVSDHGGSVEIDSEPGIGTTVRLLLPLTSDTAPTERRDSEVERGEGRILVVDDEPVARRTTAAMLRKLGYDVDAAEDGAQALEAFGRDPAAVSGVLLDMVMPGASGCEVLQKMLELRPDVRVLMVSGHVGDGPRAEAAKLGARGLLGKPFSLTQLSREIAALLKG